jgi:hypothetical protein
MTKIKPKRLFIKITKPEDAKNFSSTRVVAFSYNNGYYYIYVGQTERWKYLADQDYFRGLDLPKGIYYALPKVSAVSCMCCEVPEYLWEKNYACD